MTASMTRRTLLTALGLSVTAGALTRGGAFAQSATPAAAATPMLPVTVKDVTGKDVTITDISRIVPLSGDIAEIVYDLGFGPNIVGVDLSAVYPKELAALPQIGFERNLAAEPILALSPTLVIGKEQAGPPPVLDQLRGAGVAVLIIGEPQTIDAPIAKINAVADALGVSEAGDALARQTKAAIDEQMARVANTTDKPRTLFIYVRGGGTQLIGGAGSVADAMIGAAGGTDVGVEAGIQGFAPVTAEAVAAAAPDVIVVPQSGLDSIGGLNAFLQIPGVAQTPAGQSGRIVAIDDLLLLSMTPRTGEGLMLLIDALHPELASGTPTASPVASPAS